MAGTSSALACSLRDASVQTVCPPQCEFALNFSNVFKIQSVVWLVPRVLKMAECTWPSPLCRTEN
jgi:hypothetical protein